ncbi:MAG: hypothetical protein U1F57_05645 [bacterium]
MEKALRKYLERHAEPESRFAPRIRDSFDHVLILPAYGEGENLFKTLHSVPLASKALVILVLNATESSPEWVHAQNREVLGRIRKNFKEEAKIEASPLSVFQIPTGTLLLVNRAVPGFFLPEKEGVGLARKIGSDLALALHAEGKIRSPWIHSTDADATLPPDYFRRSEGVEDEEITALLYPYRHETESFQDLAEAMRIYDAFLRYYVAALAWAGSPYAFPTIGSTLAVRASSYAEVGGFPKRQAGEDFHLLNKLAKIGKVIPLEGDSLRIQARLSERTPFGTGQALRKILEEKKKGGFYPFYHPEIFSYLKKWLAVLEQFAVGLGQEDLSALLKSSFPEEEDAVWKVLRQMEAFPAFGEAASRSSDAQTLKRHLHTWFDAFRTLKFVHGLRDACFPSVSEEEALSKAPWGIP